MPITGRKHQLRVQCADILRTPILGDYLYGREKNSWFMYLHCWQMTFPVGLSSHLAELLTSRCGNGMKAAKRS